MVKEISQNEFEESINKEGLVLVDCYAPWCGPCRMLSPIIDELANEVNTCSFYKINIDEADEIVNKYGIMSIPTILIFENGSLKQKEVGFKSKGQLLDILK